MDKAKLIEKLKELSINSVNCYPKSTFLKNNKVFVGLYDAEMKDDFYFYNTFDKVIYKAEKIGFESPDNEKEQNNSGKTKTLIPLSKCVKIWEDKPYEELPDISFKEITVRQYACIQLKVPSSGLPWLDEIIKNSNI